MLNPSQRNSLSITLRIFEENLRQADAWLQSEENAGILYRHSLRLSPESKGVARHVIEAALNEIAELAHEFGLKPVEKDLTATVIATMSTDWVHLCDAHSDTLVQYGAVDPRLAQTLDPRLDRLAEMALLLAAAVRGRQAEEQPDCANP